MRSIVLAAALLTTLPLAAQTTRNVPYTSGKTADLYAATTPGLHPAIIYIHGGSWRSGSKSEFRRLATDLAAQGYVGLSIDYDLQSHSWPNSLHQSQAAVAFLRSHADEYHIDPNHIIVVGTSAGAELAALLALDPAQHIAAAVILNGVFDLTVHAYVIHRYLGVGCAPVQPACTDASPINQIHPGAPPFFVGHGTSDHTVPYLAAQNFIAALQQAKVPVTPYIAQGGPHMYWEKSSFYANNLSAIEAFLSHTP